MARSDWQQLECSILKEANGCNIYGIMKTLRPPRYIHIDFSAINTAGYTMCGYVLLLPINERLPRKQKKERNISGHL